MDATLSGATARALTDDTPSMSEARPAPHIVLLGEEPAVADYLTENRFRVSAVDDEAALFDALQTSVVDAIVLAPDVDDAPRFAQRLRDESPVPIIVLSARRDEFDRVMALELGADDCLTHPFSLRELLARVRALLRRRRLQVEQANAPGPRAYRFGEFELNVNTRRLASSARRPVTLTNGEFSLLVALLGAGGRTLTRMQILELSRLHDDEVYDRAVDSLVMRLRRKLEADTGAPRYLVTVRGAGYRLGVPAEAVY